MNDELEYFPNQIIKSPLQVSINNLQRTNAIKLNEKQFMTLRREIAEN